MTMNHIQTDGEINTNNPVEVRSCRTSSGHFGGTGDGFGHPIAPRTDVGLRV
jgi:hypothetical protein